MIYKSPCIFQHARNKKNRYHSTNKQKRSEKKTKLATHIEGSDIVEVAPGPVDARLHRVLLVIVAGREGHVAHALAAGARGVGPVLKGVGRQILGVRLQQLAGGADVVAAPPGDGRLGRLRLLPRVVLLRVVAVEDRVTIHRLRLLLLLAFAQTRLIREAELLLLLLLLAVGVGVGRDLLLLQLGKAVLAETRGRGEIQLLLDARGGAAADDRRVRQAARVGRRCGYADVVLQAQAVDRPVGREEILRMDAQRVLLHG